MSQKIKIGTRKSELALTQTNLVHQTLLSSNINSEVEHILTTGDKDLRPFQNIIGDGFFTKEVERQLLKNNIQLAVHSCKDLPSMTHSQLPWVAFSEREDTVDILIIKKEFVVSEKPLKLKPGLAIGTSSPRRSAQLQQLFPQCQIQSIRGNVPTRVEKVLTGEVDATVLAKAGVNRLNLSRKILEKNLLMIDLPLVTAPCQGILAVQGQAEHSAKLNILNNQDLSEIAFAEKSILALLGGGCHLAVGAKIQKLNNKFHLDFFLSEDNKITELEFSENSIAELLRSLLLKICGINSPCPRVILTQAIQHQLKVSQKIAAAGFAPVPWTLREVLPIWKISDFENINQDFQNFSSVIFTSQFAVQIFMNEFISLYPTLLDTLKTKKIYAIGESTSKKLLSYAKFDIHVPENSHAESLAQKITDSNPLFVGSEDSILLNLFKNQGRNYRFLKIYESFKSKGPLSDLPEFKSGDKLILTSASAARDFAEVFLHNMFTNIQIFSFGPTTSKVLKEKNIPYTENPKSGSWDEIIKLLTKK